MRTLVLLSLLICASVRASADDPAPLRDQAPAWAKAIGHGAVATAEKRDGRWQYAIAGEAFDPPREESPAPERVLFEIGSISKVFTGLLLAHAVHEGKLGLDDTLAQRLPVKLADPRLRAVTLRQLATHTSCLPRLPDNLQGASTDDPYAHYGEPELFKYLQKARLETAPPCKPDYSNLGFGILGVVLEHAYGKPWAALVREKIAAPLGMVDTVQALSADQARRFAQPWAADQHAQPWTFQAVAGAGALRSTLADMSRFADALLARDDGPLKGLWPILAGDYADMPMVGGRIGLALLHDRHGDVDGYWHDGGTGGFRSEIQLFPASGKAWIVLASNAAAAPEAWVSQWRNVATPALERTAIATADSDLDEYVGVYPIAKQASFTVLKVDGGLRVRLTGQPFLPIFASAKDEFFLKVVDAQLSFKRDAAGKIQSIVLHQNGRDMAADRASAPAPPIRFLDAATLAEYAGDYDFGKFQSGSIIAVQVKNDTLFAQLTGQQFLPIFATAKDRFEWDVVPAVLTFERDSDGRIIAATLHQNGADMRAPRK